MVWMAHILCALFLHCISNTKTAAYFGIKGKREKGMTAAAAALQQICYFRCKS